MLNVLFLVNGRLYSILVMKSLANTFAQYLSICRNKIYTQNFVQNYATARYFSNKLTHVDKKGEISMVDVSFKQNTIRNAEAEARIYLGPTVFQLVKENKMKKGDVLSVANIAGILAAKKTCDIIPLCHSIRIDHIKLDFTMLPDEHEIIIKSSIKTVDRTGAEMEALVSANVAALTIYDMCKAVSREMVVKSVKLVLKTGGKENFEKN